MNFEKARKTAENLVSQMTAEEKMSQLLYDSPGIERLGIKEYNWWNEACHGVARAGTATVFPQTIALAATFDEELTEAVADAVSTEGRAKYNLNVKNGDRGIYKGLSYWSPNINIFRDPRWGRGQETFGEDPFLSSTLGCAYIRGLQGDGEYLKSAACAKHFAVHSGPESLRHSFDAKASKKDMSETYLPAFEQAVKTGVMGVMGAYNRTNGLPCCAHTGLINMLRNEWGFKGYFVSDCGAISDIYENHHFSETETEAAATALKAGCNLNCGEAYKSLVDAYEEDLVDEKDITDAAVRLFTIRALLGEFEENRPFADIPYKKLCCDEHKNLNLTAARESLVLLKNENSFLPIDKNEKKSIAVIGPNAMSVIALEGNYNGHADEYITVADGIRRVFSESRISVSEGCRVFFDETAFYDGFNNLENEAAQLAAEADITVLCLGLDRDIEGEDIGCENAYSDHGDKKTLLLPSCQQKLIDRVIEKGKDIVVVTLCGSCIDIGEKLRNKAKAIIHGWYPGAVGGLAVAELIAGEFSPSGKLPVTFYGENNFLPDICDYGMKNRTYRFIEEKPIYPFGYGLGYAQAEYLDFKAEKVDGEKIEVSVTVKNNSEIDLTEKVQIYAEFTHSRTQTPNCQLCAVKAVKIGAGETKTVKATVNRYWLKAVLSDGTRVDPDGKISLFAGSHQPDERSRELCNDECLSVEI